MQAKQIVTAQTLANPDKVLGGLPDNRHRQVKVPVVQCDDDSDQEELQHNSDDDEPDNYMIINQNRNS